MPFNVYLRNELKVARILFVYHTAGIQLGCKEKYLICTFIPVVFVIMVLIYILCLSSQNYALHTSWETSFDELTITYLSATSTPRNTIKITFLLKLEIWLSGNQKLHNSHNSQDWNRATEVWAEKFWKLGNGEWEKLLTNQSEKPHTVSHWEGTMKGNAKIYTEFFGSAVGELG